MRTVYGKLTSLIILLLAALLLLVPMRSGYEDHLYAHPHSLRMRKGDTYTITYTLDSDRAQNITYTSVDPGIVRVNQLGEVTAMNPGATDIHLDAEGGSKTTVRVEVIGTPTTQVLLNASSVTMERGEVTGLNVSFNDGADDTRVEWRSQDPEIAQVDAIGRVTAMRGGRTRIYAVAPNGLNAAAEIFVHVSGDAVRITPEELTVGTGAQLRMSTYYLPDDTTDTVARWTTSDPNILTVSDDGVIRAVGVGEAVLSVFTEEGLSASNVIHVEQAADRFGLSPSAVTIERGKEIQLDARFLDAAGNPDPDAEGHYVAWQSTNPEIAAVDNGKVRGLRAGSVVISATADGKTAICNLRVSVLVHAVTLDQDEVYMLREDTVKPIQLHATISPSDPDDPTITYSSNNEMVAYVDQNGLVQMTGGYGTAIITARAASGAEAHFSVNVVTQLPDPDAEPTVNPFASEAPETDEAGTGTVDSADISEGFSFDDIGKAIQSRRSVSDLEAGASTVSPDAAPAGGGFSFDDIGNGVEARLDADDLEGKAAPATAAPSPTPRTNMSQEAEAAGLF